jgi:hypothetical protein
MRIATAPGMIDEEGTAPGRKESGTASKEGEEKVGHRQGNNPLAETAPPPNK